MPAAVLERHSNPRELALRVFNSLSESFRPESRAVANLYLQLAETAGLRHEAEQFQQMLGWWAELSESDALAEVIVVELRAGDISPDLLWTLVEKSKNIWPPARRLALLNAYGEQPDGIPLRNRFRYLLESASALWDAGRFPEALDDANEALDSEFPEPAWSSKVALYSVLGLTQIRLGRLGEGMEWLESARRIAEANLPPNHPGLAASLHNLAALYAAQGKYAEAEPLYGRAGKV